MKKRSSPARRALLWTAGAAIGALMAYELWSLGNDEGEDTISENYWKIAASYPILPFAMGTLFGGHFNWQSKDVYDSARAKKKK